MRSSASRNYLALKQRSDLGERPEQNYGHSVRIATEGGPGGHCDLALALDALRTIGAAWSGKTPGSGGRFRVMSRIARMTSRIACGPLVLPAPRWSPGPSAPRRQIARPSPAYRGRLVSPQLPLLLADLATVTRNTMAIATSPDATFRDLSAIHPGSAPRLPTRERQAVASKPARGTPTRELDQTLTSR